MRIDPALTIVTRKLHWLRKFDIGQSSPQEINVDESEKQPEADAAELHIGRLRSTYRAAQDGERLRRPDRLLGSSYSFSLLLAKP